MNKKIITLCGSSKFKKEFEETKSNLEKEGNIVLSLEVFSKNDGIHFSNEQIKLLKEIHKNKISLSDEIYVINKNKYIGIDTLEEIVFAKLQNKKINYIESFD